MRHPPLQGRAGVPGRHRVGKRQACASRGRVLTGEPPLYYLRSKAIRPSSQPDTAQIQEYADLLGTECLSVENNTDKTMTPKAVKYILSVPADSKAAIAYRRALEMHLGGRYILVPDAQLPANDKGGKARSRGQPWP